MTSISLRIEIPEDIDSNSPQSNRVHVHAPKSVPFTQFTWDNVEINNPNLYKEATFYELFTIV
jgi:hypothetical protein